MLIKINGKKYIKKKNKNKHLYKLRKQKFDEGYEVFRGEYINTSFESLLLLARADRGMDGYIKKKTQSLFKGLGALMEKPKPISKPLFDVLSKFVLYPDLFAHKLSGTVKRIIQSVYLTHLQNIIDNTRLYTYNTIDKELNKFWSPFKKKYIDIYGKDIYDRYLSMVKDDKIVSNNILDFKKNINIKYLT